MISNYDKWRLASPPEHRVCEECPCEEPDEPEGISASGEICTHPDVCGCNECQCDCHNIDDGSAAYEDMLDRQSWEADNYDYDAGR